MAGKKKKSFKELASEAGKAQRKSDPEKRKRPVPEKKKATVKAKDEKPVTGEEKKMKVDQGETSGPADDEKIDDIHGKKQGMKKDEKIANDEDESGKVEKKTDDDLPDEEDDDLSDEEDDDLSDEEDDDLSDEEDDLSDEEDDLSDEEDDLSDEEEDDLSDEEDDVEIVDDERDDIGYTVKQKPELGEETRHYLKLRAERKKKQPQFLREEWHRYKRLGKKWRKPTGLHSKMRRNKRYRTPMARAGYGTTKKVRGLHPSGFREIMIFNPSDLEKIDPKIEAARVGGSVGKRKLLQIYKVADEKNIRILNRKDTSRSNIRRVD